MSRAFSILPFFTQPIYRRKLMDPRTLLDTLKTAERLKDTTRHCFTSKGRHESVAEHSFLAALMAFFLRDEFPDADMDKVIRMCLIHDLGECFIGDIPAFHKEQHHEETEEKLLHEWTASLPAPYNQEMADLYTEMKELSTTEARIYKAIDNLEAVIQHNLSDISTWIPLEFDLNLTYGNEKVAFSPYLTALRDEIRKDTIRKIDENK
jgi:putative hydrolase of HD superfamily